MHRVTQLTNVQISRDKSWIQVAWVLGSVCLRCTVHLPTREDIPEAVESEGTGWVRERRKFQQKTTFTMTLRSEECGSLGRTVYCWVWMWVSLCGHQPLWGMVDLILCILSTCYVYMIVHSAIHIKWRRWLK